MAYDKNIWSCGDEITAEKLNHMEDGIENAGGGDAGYECEEATELIWEGNVTTEANPDGAATSGDLEQIVNAPLIKVTFDGEEYALNNNGSGRGGEYGATFDDETQQYDFSEVPFHISSMYYNGWHLNIYTQTAGTYSVKIESLSVEITSVTPCFEKAVYKAGLHFIGSYTGYIPAGTTVNNGQLTGVLFKIYNSDHEEIDLLPNSDIVIYKEVSTSRPSVVLEGFGVAANHMNMSITTYAESITYDVDTEAMQIDLYKFGN